MTDGIDYTIAAIPTFYRGRRYRSRLEARWAAFFDLLRWSAEYEPRDLGAWSPDFALWHRRPNHPVMVEVKPIRRWNRTVARKIADAARDTDIDRVMLLGEAPRFGAGWPDGDRPEYGFDVLGWIGAVGHLECDWTEALLGTGSGNRHDIFPSAAHWCQESTFHELCEDLALTSFAALWAEAANIVQWKGPRK